MLAVTSTFNPSTQEAEAGRSPKFEASLIYIRSSRTARATQRRPVSEKKKKKKKVFFIFLLACVDFVYTSQVIFHNPETFASYSLGYNLVSMNKFFIYTL